jgi:Chemotaxis phosphatase CheX
MTSIDHHAVSSEFPFASLLRSSDRERILVQLMTSVWETILQLPILPRDGHEGNEVRSGDLPLLTGRIQIAGAWEGTVAMTGPRSFAAKCAAIMHGREPEALTEAEVRDGWGELVNMVGGNLKALVPPVSRLGLPTVLAREVFGYEEEGSRVLNDMIFACLGQRVRLTVLQPRR